MKKYAAMVMDEALEWLSLYHLEPGMSADGIWREGFAQHGTVLATLYDLAADLRQADVSIRPVASPMLKLARFTEIFLTEDGACGQQGGPRGRESRQPRANLLAHAGRRARRTQAVHLCAYPPDRRKELLRRRSGPR